MTCQINSGNANCVNLTGRVGFAQLAFLGNEIAHIPATDDYAK